jgi:hypothetical protein
MTATTEIASATVVGTPNGQGGHNHTITRNDTGSTTIGTFWFSWIPGQDHMSVNVVSMGNPSGWNSVVTTNNYSGQTGYAIQWVAASSASYLQPGHASSAFTFSSTETPARLGANSPLATATPTTTSFVYQQGPFSDAGFELIAAVECFRERTCILTPDGDLPIETLRADDPVITAAGEIRPVVWTGRRRIDCLGRPALCPVRVRAGALAPATPRADLYLSSNHALLLDGVLIPVRCLINGTTIAPVPVATVVWCHLELASHDAFLAEGVPAETYLDTGRRAAFQDQGEQPTIPAWGQSGDARS